ncbi:MAG TPA: FGGY-family carbohydrate kinase, partial [Paracoccaceae bacterium]|nr:FGGY-family carbohydrate kinase [Paracoccaceae bacterium]
MPRSARDSSASTTRPTARQAPGRFWKAWAGAAAGGTGRACGGALAATGTSLDRLIAVGGGARSETWIAMLATVLGLPVQLPAAGDFGAAFGAARLGLMAATGAGPAVCTAPPIARSFDPDTALAPAF